MKEQAPRVAEAIVESNGLPGYLERFLTRYKGKSKAAATWEPARG